MGKVVRFDPKRRAPRRWTSAADYGAPEPPEKPKRNKPPRKRGGLRAAIDRMWEALRPFVLIGVLALAWYGYSDRAYYQPPAWLAGDPVRVEGDFTRCGPGRGALCVIDGDTIKLGDRKVRVTGIDAPEVEARCDEEAQLAERASAALQTWVNKGAFTMVARLDSPTDKYGRDLMSLSRKDADGRAEYAADALIAQGVVRRYAGEGRGGWCD